MAHGTNTMAESSAHAAIEVRQSLVALASGTENCGAIQVPTASIVTYPEVTIARRSGKYFLTSGGNTTLPMPYPASVITDSSRKLLTSPTSRPEQLAGDRQQTLR